MSKKNDLKNLDGLVIPKTILSNGDYFIPYNPLSYPTLRKRPSFGYLQPLKYDSNKYEALYDIICKELLLQYDYHIRFMRRYVYGAYHTMKTLSLQQYKFMINSLRRKRCYRYLSKADLYDEIEMNYIDEWGTRYNKVRHKVTKKYPDIDIDDDEDSTTLSYTSGPFTIRLSYCSLNSSTDLEILLSPSIEDTIQVILSSASVTHIRQPRYLHDGNLNEVTTL